MDYIEQNGGPDAIHSKLGKIKGKLMRFRSFHLYFENSETILIILKSSKF